MITDYVKHLNAKHKLQTKQKRVDGKPLIPPISNKFFPSLNYAMFQTVYPPFNK